MRRPHITTTGIFALFLIYFSTISAFHASADDSIRHIDNPVTHNADIQPARSPMPKRMTLSDVRQRDDLAKAADKMLSTPDFAFPATVASNAHKIYDDALEARLPVTALRAAMQWNVAESLITPDSISAGLQLYDRLEQRLSQPYAALAALRKAPQLWTTSLTRRYIYHPRTSGEGGAAGLAPPLLGGD